MPLFMLSLVTVVMAIANTSPKARIVVHVPSNMIKEGSKIYFNEKHHGRLLLSRDWKGDAKRFQQFGKQCFLCRVREDKKYQRSQPFKFIIYLFMLSQIYMHKYNFFSFGSCAPGFLCRANRVSCAV